MSDNKPQLSPAMSALAEAVRGFKGRVRTVLCGFDLWLEIMGSGHTTMCNFRAGGEIADGSESETTLVVPVVVIGGHIVVSFDATLAADKFELRGEPA